MMTIPRMGLERQNGKPLVALAAAFFLMGCASDTGGNHTSSGGSDSGGANVGGTGTGGGTSTGGVGTGGASSGGGTSGTECTTPGPASDECTGHTCCDGHCVNLANDTDNCGECGKTCDDANPYCDNGTCGMPPCDAETQCTAGTSCCGDSCCGEGEICCTVPGPVVSTTSCVSPTEDGTCPLGCVLCGCLSPDTPIATPEGDRPVASLETGDLVYSVDDAAIVTVPVAMTSRKPVADHEIVQLRLSNGTTLEMSADHPLADGRNAGELWSGSDLDGVEVVEATVVPYHHPFTHDILPKSSTGTYFVAGVAVNSTLSP